jgi:hypothetical protein
MFANQRRGSIGLESLFAVALVLLGFVSATGLMVKVYRAGGDQVTPCELVCRQATTVANKG